MFTLKERVWSPSHRVWLNAGSVVSVEGWLEDGSALVRVGKNLVCHVAHEDADKLMESVDAAR